MRKRCGKGTNRPRKGADRPTKWCGKRCGKGAEKVRQRCGKGAEKVRQRCGNISTFSAPFGICSGGGNGTYEFTSVRVCVRVFVRVCVRPFWISASTNKNFLILCTKLGSHKVSKVTFSDFRLKVPFSFFLVKIWPFWPKNDHFCQFLPNASLDLPNFWYRNCIYGLLL